ncbi:beta-propeller fold lactonase family protein [Microbacterium sp.]|uniref:lactonase family protein n=1 Tax=Microbacterium sp. TaxID=51671 RepID=UPI00273643CE|nr:beta-propeller fold lactonase family protein [Microbacterium sp.]MDP3952586.1 beta-propeller fold lactonase family protein [Microbacterium sp.]
MTQFWVGGYDAGMGGDATGIGLLEGDEGREPDTLAYRGAVTQTASPSWLARHPSLDVVYAALEGDGTVQAFVRTGQSTLAPLGRATPTGDSVCHVAVAASGSYLIASCYGDGRVVRIDLSADGSLLKPTVSAAARDPYDPDAAQDAANSDPEEPSAQEIAAAMLRSGSMTFEEPSAEVEAPPRSGLLLFDEMLGMNTAPAPEPEPAEEEEKPARSSHAHAAAFLPDGRIATTDLGFDLVRIWRPTAGGLTLDHEVVLPLGTGPRHMVVHQSGHLHVVTEYSCEIFTLAAQPDGRWALAAATMVTPAAEIGTDFPAELARSRDGATLYTALRGSNTIAALRVSGAGESVEPFALAESGVDWPRHHLVHDGALLVAGQRSNEISVLDLDDRTGAPRGIRHRTSAPAPTSLLLAR